MLVNGAFDWKIVFRTKLFILGYVSFQSLIGQGSASDPLGEGRLLTQIHVGALIP